MLQEIYPNSTYFAKIAFINSYDRQPELICLDFDPTDVTIYGNQESKHYHGYYNDYCYLPLIVTCDHHLLVAHLRPSNIDGAKGCGLCKMSE